LGKILVAVVVVVVVVDLEKLVFGKNVVAELRKCHGFVGLQIFAEEAVVVALDVAVLDKVAHLIVVDHQLMLDWSGTGTGSITFINGAC
jgi:hypothetical protein